MDRFTRAFGDQAVSEDATLADQDSVADRTVVDHSERADEAFGADFGAAEQLNERLDDGVGCDLDFSVEDAGIGAEDASDALIHEPLCGCGATCLIARDLLGNRAGGSIFVDRDDTLSNRLATSFAIFRSPRRRGMDGSPDL